MLPMSPMRLRRRAHPVALGARTALAAACSDPSAPVAPRVGGAAHPDMAVTYVVTNTDDAGPGSLRQTITIASDGDVIRFAPAIGAANRWPLEARSLFNGSGSTEATKNGGGGT